MTDSSAPAAPAAPATPPTAPAGLDPAALYPHQAGVDGQTADANSKVPLAPIDPAAPPAPAAGDPPAPKEGEPGFLAPKDPAAPVPKEGEVAPPAPPAPIDYSSLKLEEGFTVAPETMTKFQEIAQKAGVTPEAAQEFLNLQTEWQKANSAETIALLQTQDREWAAELSRDPNFSGANETLVKTAIAKAIEEFGDPAVFQTLDAYGLSNNPALVRFIGKMAQALGEGQPTAPGAPRLGGGVEVSSQPLAQRLYPSHYPPT